MIEIYLIGAVITALVVMGLFASFKSLTEMHWPKFTIVVVFWPVSIPIMILVVVVEALLEWLNSR